MTSALPEGSLGISQNETVIHFSRGATIFAAVSASVFTAVGIAGNLLTVVALSRCPKLRSHATTMFVISLAISDLLFSAINLPLTASRYIHEEWKFGETMCRIFPFFFYGNVAASLMNMVAITVNRYILISCHANYSRIFSGLNIWLMIAFVWLFSFGMMVPPLVEVWGALGLHEPTFSCTILEKNDESPKKFLMLFGFLMPCIAIVCCYTAIFCKVKQSRRNVQAHMANNGGGKHTTGVAVATDSAQSTSQRREDMRLTKMMLTIFLCFVVCFFPLMLVNVADEDVDYPFLHVLASVLAWASAVINPFIYAFKNRQYQQAFAKVLCRQPTPTSATRGTNVSKESKTSASRTFLTDMLHFNTATDKIRMMRNNHSSPGIQTDGRSSSSGLQIPTKPDSHILQLQTAAVILEEPDSTGTTANNIKSSPIC